MSNAALKPTDKEAKSAEKPSQKVKDELAARKMALLLYFLRDPVFASVTQPATGKVRTLLTLWIVVVLIRHPPFDGLLTVCLSSVSLPSCCRLCPLQACDVLDYVPVVGRVVRFASTSVMNYYHQFHFYTSAS